MGVTLPPGGGGGSSNMVTGTYTGDGTVSQAITGVGFKPKTLMVFADVGDASACYPFLTSDTFSTSQAGCFYTATGGCYTNRIDSLDADGFTVDDEGANSPPNTFGALYNYVAWS